MPRTLYARQWIETITAGHSKKVFSERVPPGNILVVQRCFFHVPEAEANDLLTIYVENGGQDIVLRSRKMTTALNGMSIFNRFPTGESDRIYGYAPDADEGDSLVLNVVGEMIPIDEWRNYQD